MSTDTAVGSISGAELREAFAAAARWLDRNAATVNAINVFPVPDGDTGTNMAATLAAAVAEAERAPDDLPAVTKALAHGALMGARGNSGVILSQYLRGIAATLADRAHLDAAALAAALSAGATAARSAVATPREGTILTVATDTGVGATAAVATGAGPLEALDRAVLAARESVARTPELLPVLREAGVVDSGGFGLAVILEGLLRQLRGEPLPAEIEDAGRIRQDWLAQVAAAHGEGGDHFGYCVQYLLRGDALDPDDLRAELDTFCDSVLVVGEPELLHIHAHSADPGAALTAATRRGALIEVKIDNMEEQARRAGAQAVAATVSAGPFSIVAVAAGEGLAEALRGVGVELIVTGGQTMNPSTRDILTAIERASKQQVVVLPNNKNVIWTAEQAAGLASKNVTVVPTITMPQGIAAALAVAPEAEAADALAAMRAALAGVRTVEVTRAVRTVRLGDIDVQEGRCIALIDDELTLAGDTPEATARAAVDRLAPDEGALVTIYVGGGVDEVAAAALAEQLRQLYPTATVDLTAGGQPFYDYVISVE